MTTSMTASLLACSRPPSTGDLSWHPLPVATGLRTGMLAGDTARQLTHDLLGERELPVETVAQLPPAHVNRHLFEQSLEQLIGYPFDRIIIGLVTK